MRKKSQEELGTLVTREMKVMLQDTSLTKEQRFDILAAVMFDAPLKNTILASFAKSLKAGFEQINGSRYKAIEREREWRKNTERRRRHAGYIDENATTLDTMSPHATPCNTMSPHATPCNTMSPHATPCNSMSPHDGLKQNKTSNISPYNPPKGGVGKSKSSRGKTQKPSAQADGAAGGATTAPSCRSKGATGSAADVAAFVEAIKATEAFAHMRANDRILTRHLSRLAEKNAGREDEWRDEVMSGLAAWTEAWAADGWQFAPGKITSWLTDEKYLQPPRKKAAPDVSPGCGECGSEIV